MRIDDMILVSIDDHVVEPPDVFDHHLPARWRDVAPRVVHKESGADVWVFNGAEVPNLAINAVSGLFPEEYGLEPTAYTQIREGTYDIHARVADMDANGVLGSLNFPSFPGFSGRLFMTLGDKDAALALVRAYNDWHIDEWCGTHPGRMIPCVIAPLWDPEEMAAEIRRTAAKGAHAVTFSENPAKLGLPSLHSDHWDPFWAACLDVGTNVCMHIGSSSQLAITSPDAPVDVMIVLQGMNIVQCAADLLFSRIWKAFPGLQFSLTEGGIGWVPYFYERADDTWRVHHAWTGADFGGRMPSEVFRDHAVLCFIKDPHGLRAAREIGVDRICWETDYPHSDSTWPHAPERLARELAGTDLTDGEIEQITHRNAMRHYRYDPFRHVPRSRPPSRRCAPGRQVSTRPCAPPGVRSRSGPGR
ncbi:MAG: amidohydrolase [Acidimicrobiia bacterium]|nr:amidohydrolase [Acidimicrobiia bacterium]